MSEEGTQKASQNKKPQSQSSDNKSLKISIGLGVLLVGALAFVALKEPEPVRKPKPLPAPLVVPGSVRKGGTQQASAVQQAPVAQQKKQTENVETPARPKRPEHLEGTVQALREDLLFVAEGVYTGVRLATENNDQTQVDDRVKIDQLLKRLNVSYVEITASADSWDNLKSDQKVDLLYGTFALLKKQYPALSQYVRVVFDDDRQALDLRFDDFRTVVEKG